MAAFRFKQPGNVNYQWLAEFPELGRSRDERCQGCRSLLVKKYLVFYRLLPNAIEILRVLHGSRNLPEFFYTPHDWEPYFLKRARSITDKHFWPFQKSLVLSRVEYNCWLE
jgi:ParE toxin of type II toxin-antitoxin system, parDE